MIMVIIIIIIIITVVINQQPSTQLYVEVKGANGVVSTEDERCSDVGVSVGFSLFTFTYVSKSSSLLSLSLSFSKKVLQRGGTATDAAIAAALCIGVVHGFCKDAFHFIFSFFHFVKFHFHRYTVNSASGIGGGGFMLVYSTLTRASSLFDFREEAPNSAYQTMFVANPTLSTRGGLSIAIPGEIRGFESAHNKYGALSWGSLFLPAIGLILFVSFRFVSFRFVSFLLV
jgi:gamma-glutamyltranspeptidase